jgi:hypothetical protein
MSFPIILEKLVEKTWTSEDLKNPEFVDVIQELLQILQMKLISLDEITNDNSEFKNLLSWLAKKRQSEKE